ETPPVLLRLQSHLVELVAAAIDGRLDAVQAQSDPRPSLGVAMAARPYPEAAGTGEARPGPPAPQPSPGSGRPGGAVKVCHACTPLDANGKVVSAGGRVLCVTALGDAVAGAQRNAYAGVAAISWANEFHGGDIGRRAIARERPQARDEA